MAGGLSALAAINFRIHVFWKVFNSWMINRSFSNRDGSVFEWADFETDEAPRMAGMAGMTGIDSYRGIGSLHGSLKLLKELESAKMI
jgi:uncharacterized membrane protein